MEETITLRQARKDGNVFLTLLMPAVSKVQQAQGRLGRHLAGLRAAEALRAHAAATGKLPATWSDIKDWPDPIDPLTGKGFGGFYRRKGNEATLAVPPPPGVPAFIGRRYLLSLPKK